MDPCSLEILFEDNHLLAVLKPAGLATMGLAGDKPTLLSLAKQHLKARYHKPGSVYLGVVSRLDVPVTGVVLFARTSKAARRLTEQFRDHRVRKTYWAVVEGLVRPASGDCVHWIRRDQRNRRVRIVGPSQPGAKQARLTYRRLKTFEQCSLLEVEPQTGRKHQIRVQLADLGYPILGDRKYGGRRVFAAGIALHALRLAVTHPVREERVTLEAPLPETWRSFGVLK